MTFSKLGTDSDTQQIVELSQASRRQGLYIIGANGTGKTGLIEHLILQDIDQGLGVGLLDPHGDLVNAILAKMTKREEDVILLDIQDEDHPFGLNIFECPNPQSNTAVQKIVDLVMHIFEKLYDVSRQTPRMAQFLRNCTHTLVANPGYTMADIPLLLQDEECRKKLVANVTDPQVQLFWKTYNALRPSEQFDRAESTINKMDELLQPLPRNIVGQGKTTVNIQQVMDERKILLVKLSAQLDQVTSLVGTLFIALFLNAAYSRASLAVNKRKQFNLYADEFQRFATEDFATLLTEARKFGIATTIAHQARYQPGMTDGIRAVSLQAANHVVFRVTSPDADELSGGFDITPQAAWEEEIEKEWVEVLKPEWYERVEEEVIDGEEEIQTPVKDVVGHLLNSGSHPNPVVNRFTHETLTVLKEDAEPFTLSGLNAFLFECMTSGNPTTVRFKNADKAYAVEWYCDWLLRMIDALTHDMNNLYSLYSSPMYHQVVLNKGTTATDAYKRKWGDRSIQAFYQVWKSQAGSRTYNQAVAVMDEEVKEHLLMSFVGQITSYFALIEKLRNGKLETGEIIEHFETGQSWQELPTYDVSRYPDQWKDLYWQGVIEHYQKPSIAPLSVITKTKTIPQWFSVDIDSLEWAQIEVQTPKFVNRWGIAHGGKIEKCWKILPNQEGKFYRSQDLEQIVEQAIGEDRITFLSVIEGLKAVAQALADEPIYTGSGIRQPRKRKQINYHTHPAQTLTHPRKVIMHPQRAYQDVKNDMANQLSGFPNFTARVKLSEILSHNPGKKCLSCKLLNNPGDKFCSKCGTKLPAPNEYMFTTLKPLGGLGKAALQQRLSTIQTNNIQKGYVQDRTKVEAEIINRQTQQPTPQARHARQVPVQGKCPNCGTSNSPEAKFCNQCGTKL